MFGVLASGRLVNTNVVQANENTFLLSVDHAESVNHVVVFLTGQLPFSEGFGGSIYFGWPGSQGASVSWQLLGYITNEKPSAIFKISKVKPTDMVAINPFSQDTMHTLATSTNAQIGILVEPLTEIAQKTPSANTEASKIDSYAEFCQKMLENFYNFASSFAVNPSLSPLNPSESYIPASVLQRWYTNFQRRLETNPNFWK